MAFTFFFRDLHVLNLAVEHAAPVLSCRSFPRVWDAGCAMGPEPYSLTILFADRMGPFAFKNLRVLATDLDDCQSFGEIIRAARYPDADLERIPPEYRQRYFEASEELGYSQVIAKVRERVEFLRHNLLTLTAPGDGFGLVMCKNVLLHFTAEQRLDVIRMFHRALAPGGFLVMEQTQPLPAELEPLFERVVMDGQLYRKRECA